MSTTMTMDETTNLNWQNQVKQNSSNAWMCVCIFVMCCSGMGFAVDYGLAIVIDGYDFIGAIKAFYGLELHYLGGISFTLGGMLILAVVYWRDYQLMFYGVPAITMAEHMAKQEDDYKQQSCAQIEYTVGQMSSAIGLKEPPTVMISDQYFANAYSVSCRGQNSHLVLTTGLIFHLTQDELQAVIAIELCRIKLQDPVAEFAVAAVSHLGLILFDSIYHPFLYGARKDDFPSPFTTLIKRGLVMARFLIPIATFMFRFVLDPQRFLTADALAARLLKNKTLIAKTLQKIQQLHTENIESWSKAYAACPVDEIRRESYIFDPADITASQTFVTSFTTHPSLEERVEHLGVDYQSMKHSHS